MKPMKQVSVREFNLHPTKYLGELPITLTQYKKPIADIVPHVKNSANTKDRVAKPTLEFVNIPTKVATLQKQIADIIPQEPPDTKTPGKCQAPGILCKGLGPKYKVTFYGDEGEIKKDLFLCASHLKKAREQGSEIVEV